MSYLVSTGQCSPELRAKTCRDVKRILGRTRALGLTRPSGPAAGLGCDFTLACGDIPAEPERGEPCRDLPAAIMQQLCEQLPVLQRGPSGGEIRVAVELLMDTGRRPAEILRLRFDCLTRDPGRGGRADLRQPQAGSPRAPAADQPGHRHSDHHPAAAGPGTLPRHPARRAGPAPTPARQSRRAQIAQRWPARPAPPRLGRPTPGPAPRRRHRVRPGQDRAVCLPAHRPTPRRRRDRHRRAVQAPRSPHARGHRARAGRGAATPRRRRHAHRVQLRPARQPALARRPRPAGLRAPATPSATLLSPTAAAPNRPT